MLCPTCRTEVPNHVERCVACGADAGFPNVRAAETSEEQDALARRLTAARTTALARGANGVLSDFGAAVAKSQAVLALPLAGVDTFAKSKNSLYVNFHSQFRAGGRIPEDNDWDKGRTAAEATVNPNYYEKINFAALSLDGFGVLWWGDYSISFKDLHIANRTSVFEENPFLFCERYKIVAGKPAPAGFRAAWNKRGELAMAKLVDNLQPNTVEREFPVILLKNGTSKDVADFIECHIYGPIHPTSIERVVGPRPRSKYDRVIWQSAINALLKLGVIVEEV